MRGGRQAGCCQGGEQHVLQASVLDAFKASLLIAQIFVEVMVGQDDRESNVATSTRATQAGHQLVDPASSDLRALGFFTRGDMPYVDLDYVAFGNPGGRAICSAYSDQFHPSHRGHPTTPRVSVNRDHDGRTALRAEGLHDVFGDFYAGSVARRNDRRSELQIGKSLSVYG